MPSVIQKLTLGHEIARRRVFGSMSTGADHELPLNVITYPPLVPYVTAAQKFALGQDTDTIGSPVPLMFTGVDHEVPLYVTASSLPTAAQNVELAHEIAETYSNPVYAGGDQASWALLAVAPANTRTRLSTATLVSTRTRRSM